MTLHPILARQLRRLGLDAESPPEASAWAALLKAVDASYRGADEDRYTIERAFELSSKEMGELHAQLAAATEDKLAHNAAMLSATIEAMDEGLVVIDRAGGILLHNQRYLQIWNLQVRQLEPDNLREHFFANLTVEDAAAFAANFESEDAPPFERVFHLRDGRHLRASSSPLMVGAELIGRVWLVRDETERHLREREVRDARRFLDSILEHLPDMVFVKDAASLTFVAMNRAGEELVGLSREALIGRSDADFFPREEAEAFVSRDREVLAGGVLSEVEEQISTPHGELQLHTKKIPILDDEGRPRFLLGISRDVTEQRRRSEELLVAKQAAERASRAKSEFLSNMSHELRTPLNAILGFAEMMAHEAIGPLNAHQKDAIADIRQAGTYMTELVDSLLALREVQEPSVQRLMELQPLGPILHQVWAMAEPIARERSQSLYVAPSEHLPEVQCDPRALFQVLVNLVSNAMKFTREGGRVEVQIEQLTGDLIEIAVHDTGIGIATQDLPHVFTYFAESGRLGNKMQGNGVNLALTRALVEQMGGTIVAESMLGQGSVFRVRLHTGSSSVPRSRMSRTRPVTDRPAVRGEQWRYLAQPDRAQVEVVLSEWRDPEGSIGILALVPEADRAFVPELQGIARRMGLELVGAIFPEIIVESRFHTHGVLLLELSPMPPWLIVDGLGSSPEGDGAAIRALTAFADQSPRPHVDTLFFVFDSQVPNIGTLVEGVYGVIGDHVHFAGVNAGSGTFAPMPCIFDDTDIRGNAVLAIQLAGHPGAFLDHGYTIPEAHMLATSAGGNRIQRVDWGPAFDGYRSFVWQSYGVAIDRDNFYEQAVHFPFAMIRADGEAIIRVPVGLGEDGSIHCVGEVPEGAVITVARACAHGQLTSVESLVERLDGTPGLLFFCAGRRTHLGQEASLAEVNAYTSRTRGPTLGAVSLGEIGEARHGGYPLFHNATLVALPWMSIFERQHPGPQAAAGAAPSGRARGQLDGAKP